MERIKKALERARAERDKLETGAGGATTSLAHAAAERDVDEADAPSRDGGRRTVSGEEVNVVYTRTRTFTPQPAVLRRNRVVSITDPTSPAATAFRMLRTQVLQHLRREGWSSIAITSPNEGEGKTITAVNLAVSIAREVSSTVLLVDADIGRPSVHRYFGCVPGVGLVDHLVDGAPLEDLLINPGIDRLVIIPGGKPAANSSELLGSPRMKRMVEDVKNRYPSRVVIFDLPPVLSADDALAFAPFVDAALLVLREGSTTRDEAVRALEYLGATNVIGTVLNASDDPQASYAYR